MPMIDIKNSQDVSTATVVAGGLIGGWLSARETGIRPLGGVVLAAAGAYAGRTWRAEAPRSWACRCCTSRASTPPRSVGVAIGAQRYE